MTDFRDSVDLASERLGGSVLYATDDFFAEKENLLKPHRPVWKEHEYTDRGKWMDGWESRRKRTPGHDFALLRLGLRGIPRGVVVDTSFFKGNYPSHCSIEATVAPVDARVDSLLSADMKWTEILPKSSLEGDRENLFPVDTSFAFTHLRFHIFPDGGVARLRVHGEVVPDWPIVGGLERELDLAAVEHGSEVLTCSDMFFGPKHNLILPGRSFNMSDGWETRRRRGPGHDWVIIRLGLEGLVKRIEVDTTHFKGNYPDSCSIEATRVQAPEALDQASWREIVPKKKLQAHTRHFFIDEITDAGPWTHLRLNVYPDGGVARLRVHGVPTEDARRAEVVRELNTSPSAEALFLRCCGSSEWARKMAESRPFDNWSDLLGKGDRIWERSTPDDWLEAFRAHPRIGQSASSRWAQGEQKGASSAGTATMEALAGANREYEKKFGHIYIVCASGRSAEEMLTDLRARLGHDAPTELKRAAEEQRRITHLRLGKLVNG